MPRPRRTYSGNNVISASSDPLYMGFLPGSVGTRRKRRWESSENWYHKSLNSVQDPLCVMLVVDALLKIDTSIELRSHFLVEWMDENYKQFQWDHINLGKILSALADDMNQILPKIAFLQRSRDENGVFYLLSVTPESVKLLQALRDDLMRLAKFRLQEPVGYRKAKLAYSPLDECPSLRGEFVEDED